MYRVYFIILGITMIEACAQFCIKKSTQNNDKSYLFGFLAYTFIGYLLYQLYKYKGIAYTNMVWSLLSIIIACVSGKIFFGEKINYLGCILTLLALYVINFSE